MENEDYPYGDPREEIDFPATVPGSRVMIQMKDTGHWDGEGNRVIEAYRPIIKVIHDRDACLPSPNIPEDQPLLDEGASEHQVTICLECIDSWAHDYYITLGESPADFGLRDKI